MGLASRTRRALREYWADRLGVDPDAFDRDGATVGPANPGEVELFRRADALVVGAPEWLVGPLRQRRDDLGRLDLDDPDAIEAWFGEFGSVERVLGPAFYGYVDSEAFEPVESSARFLAADRPAHERFRAAVPDGEWEAAGPELVPGRTVGLFDGDELVAVAGYDIWDDRLAHVAVVTHPEHRDEGFGRAVVSRATERAFAADLLPQYRTLDAWPWSVALARGLGYERFATGILVSFREGDRRGAVQ